MRPLIATAALLTLASPSLFAHPGHGMPGFAAGAAHPWLGVDHLLAMLAVGVIGVRLGGHGRWLVPAIFLVALSIGAALGSAGVAIPGVELAIAASVVAFGAILAFDVRHLLPIALMVAAFAIAHGHAHLAEAPVGGGLAYAVGMLFATATLHGLGVIAGLAVGRLPMAQPLRWGGAGLVLGGLALVALQLI